MNRFQDQPGASSLIAQQVYDKRINEPPRQRSFTFRMLVTLLIASGSVVWVLNIFNVVPGSWWSSVFGVIFAVIGVILALFPLSPLNAQMHHSDLSVRQPLAQHSHILLEGVTFEADDEHGALVVFVKKSLRGSTINVCRGFLSVDLTSEAAASVVGRRRLDHASWLSRILSSGPIVYVACFLTLKPGNYTVYAESGELRSRVTIHPRQVAEIDWR